MMALGFLFIDFLYFIDIMLLGVTVGVVVVSYCVYKPSLDLCDFVFFEVRLVWDCPFVRSTVRPSAE